LATALATAMPQPSVMLSAAGKLLLSATGEGVHVACVVSPASPPSTQSFRLPPVAADDDSSGAALVALAVAAAAAEGAKAWAEALPRGTLVLIGVVCLSSSTAAAVVPILQSLEASGLCCPSALPSGCRVASAVGRKGQTIWNDSHSAPDMALSSAPGLVV